jgi:hypothetical protein
MHGLKPLVWIVWLGLVMIGVEVRHLHAKIMDQAAAASPLVFCAIAAVMIPLCLIRTTRLSRRLMLCAFVVGAALGLVGVYFHTGFRVEPFLAVLTSEPRGGPQPLVPLSLTGLCTLGALVVRLLPAEASKEPVGRQQALPR